jgi:hypothetical protein
MAGLIFALATAAAARAEPTPSLRLSELIGATPAQVQGRLGGAGVPAAGLTAQIADGELQLIELHTFGASQVPEAICYADQPPPPDAPPSRTVLMVFRQGRLTGAVVPGQMRGPFPSPQAGFKAMDAYMRSPLSNGLVARPGELPLESGLSDLVQRLGEPLAADAEIVRKCRPTPAITAPSPGRRHFDEAGFFQGLALLPLAATLPGLNAERARARTEGPRTLAELRLGEALEGGVDSFAASRHGVFAEHGRGGYAVLVINLGAESSNNVSRMNEAAFAGVRDGRVEWIAPSMRQGPGHQVGLGLCEGADRRPSRARRGCTDYGFFSP